MHVFKMLQNYTLPSSQMHIDNFGEVSFQHDGTPLPLLERRIPKRIIRKLSIIEMSASLLDIKLMHFFGLYITKNRKWSNNFVFSLKRSLTMIGILVCEGVLSRLRRYINAGGKYFKLDNQLVVILFNYLKRL